MHFDTWLVFLTGVIVICGSPGPNMLQVMTCSARHGFRRAFFTMAGCFIPVFLMILASLAGVDIVLKHLPALFDALRYAGAAYLIYLGIGAWRASVADHSEDAVRPESSGWKIFRHGFLVGISNPKALLFATAFFPQFLDPALPETLQFVVMLATFSVVEISWYMVYALGGRGFTRAMRQPSVQRRFNRLTGSLFIFFGTVMAVK